MCHLPRSPRFTFTSNPHIHLFYTLQLSSTPPALYWRASDTLCCLYSILSAKLLFVFIYPPATRTHTHRCLSTKVRLHILFHMCVCECSIQLYSSYVCVSPSVLHIYNLCFVIQLTFSADKHFWHTAPCCIANNLKSHFIQFQSCLRVLPE